MGSRYVQTGLAAYRSQRSVGPTMSPAISCSTGVHSCRNPRDGLIVGVPVTLMVVAWAQPKKVKTVEFAGCSCLRWSLLAMLATLFLVVARIPRRDTATRLRTRSRAQLPGASSYPHSGCSIRGIVPPLRCRTPRMIWLRFVRLVNSVERFGHHTRRTVTRRHARLPWPRSPRAGGDSRCSARRSDVRFRG